MTRVQVLDTDPSRGRGAAIYRALRERAPSTVVTHKTLAHFPDQAIDENIDLTVVVVRVADIFDEYRAADFLARLSLVTDVIVIGDRPFSRIINPPFEVISISDGIDIPSAIISHIVRRIGDEQERQETLNKVRESLLRALEISIADLGLPSRLTNVLYNNNIKSLRDVVTKTEAELLRIPDLGRDSFKRIRSVVERHGLRFDMDLSNWSLEQAGDGSEVDAAARKLARVRQEPLGATFAPANDVLAIDAHGEDEDAKVAEKPHVRQLHEEIRRKASRFTNVASRLDNQPAWQGIGGFCERLERLLARPTSDVPDVIGLLYSATLELGSFLEMDRRIASGGNGFTVELGPEVRRPLEDLLSSLAPWMRSFPTVREMDDEAGRFLTRNQFVETATTLVEKAESNRLVAPDDIAVLRGLADAAHRGEFQGIKAGHREVLSVRNMILAASVAVGGLLWSAAESEFANHSVIGKKAGMFLAATEGEVLQIVSELPRDLQLAIELIIEEAKRQPVLPSQPPSEIPSPPPPPVRRKRR